jgi:hypothetical protein
MAQPKQFWPLILLVAFGGCGAAANSGAAGSGTGEIAAPGADGADRCIFDAHVLDPGNRRTMIWGVSLLDGGTCVRRIRVNERPRGYELLPRSRPVTSGRSYPVFVRGPGYEVTLQLPL